MTVRSSLHYRHGPDRPFRPAPGWLRKVTAIVDGLLRGAEWSGENLGPIVFTLMLLYGIGIMVWQWPETSLFTGLLMGAILAPILGLLTAILALPLLLAVLIGAALLRIGCEIIAALGEWELPDYFPITASHTGSFPYQEPVSEVLPVEGRTRRDGKTDFLTGLVMGMVLGFWLDD